jgi:ribonuclease HI
LGYPSRKTYLTIDFLYKMSSLIIYTDGAARGNPGPGGYGAILQWGDAVKEISQGYRRTTNNRMELMAVIAALQQLKRDNVDVTIYSDSAYVVNAVEKGWLKTWERINFKAKKNTDLWKQFLTYQKKHRIRFVWVKGHADNKWNNRCDVLATAAADSRNWLVDEGYENAGEGTLL